VAVKKQVGAEVNIAELAGDAKEEFWDAAMKLVFDMLTDLIRDVVDYELEEFIGAGWHERNAPGRRTTRAGTRKRRFTILGRDVDLRIPRARIAGFRSKFIEHRQRRHEHFDRAVVNAYVAGTSMRETTALFHEMFETSVSPSTVSKLVREVDAEREAFQSRRLDDDYRYVIFDGMFLRCMVRPAPKVKGAKQGETVEKVAVLLARGIKEDGTRELIDFRVATGETELAWEAFLGNLFDRGLEGSVTKLFVHDGSEAIERAIESVYGEVGRQRCICHKIVRRTANRKCGEGEGSAG
jgi:putative transposase